MPAYDKELFAPPAPLVCVDRLGATPAADQYYELMSFDGSTSLAPVVRLEMIFVGRTFKGQFLLIDQPWGVLGRNILNAVPLLLDGPRLTWSVSPTRQGAG